MRYFITFVLVVFTCSFATAFEEMSDTELKATTAQFGAEAGDIGSASDGIAPTLTPVAPVLYLYDIVSPHIDPASQINETSSTAAPVTRIMQTVGDITFFGGLF
jgi:hypothetical protein